MEAPRPRSTDKYSDSFMLHSVAPRFVYYKHQATNLNSRMLRMKTIAEIRFDNLQKLLADLGNGDLTTMLVKSKNWLSDDHKVKLNRANLYQILTKRETAAGATRGIGDDLARKIEYEFDLETGWLDNIHGADLVPALPDVEPDAISEIIAVYLYSDATGRRGIMSAVETAKETLPTSARNKLKDRR